MKQFRCADIVPGCSATVRAKSVDEVIAVATGHLQSRWHSFAASPDLTARVTKGVGDVSLLRVLFDRY